MDQDAILDATVRLRAHAADFVNCFQDDIVYGKPTHYEYTDDQLKRAVADFKTFRSTLAACGIALLDVDYTILAPLSGLNRSRVILHETAQGQLLLDRNVNEDQLLDWMANLKSVDYFHSILQYMEMRIQPQLNRIYIKPISCARVNAAGKLLRKLWDQSNSTPTEEFLDAIIWQAKDLGFKTPSVEQVQAASFDLEFSLFGDEAAFNRILQECNNLSQFTSETRQVSLLPVVRSFARLRKAVQVMLPPPQIVQ